MSDYWKSQAKKFCKFCECWITDNKATVGFHERGKRHKENVAKKLKDVTKNSKKELKTQLKIKDEIEKMEKAGMEAYLRDVEENADYTSGILRKEIILESTDEKTKKIQEQNDLLKMHYIQKLAKETELHKKQNEEAKEESRARQLRENMKKRKVDTTEQPKYFGPILPDTKDSPYGQWLAVDKINKLNLQLPVQAPKVELIKIKKPQFVFKEKLIRQLETEDDFPNTSQFKRRKLNSNIRKRCDPE